jgi:hypothetical protein
MKTTLKKEKKEKYWFAWFPVKLHYIYEKEN